MYRGFHLLEILATLTIISLLIAVSLPVYTQYLVKAKRAEVVTVSKLAFAMEQFHLEHDTYEHARLADLQIPQTVAKNHYQLANNAHLYR